MNSEKFSLKSRTSSFKFAFRGLSSLLVNEHNSIIHLAAAVIVIALGFILKVNPCEWCLLIIVIGLVFLAEILNSSLEAIADVIEPQWNEKIMRAKDYAAAAVLISVIVAVLVGALIFIPRLLLLM
jgi:diacylglycerol kinase